MRKNEKRPGNYRRPNKHLRQKYMSRIWTRQNLMKQTAEWQKNNNAPEKSTITPNLAFPQNISDNDYIIPQIEFVSSNRGYSPWSHVDDETPEDKEHARKFIRLQEGSAAGVAVSSGFALGAGFFEPVVAYSLMATGGGNAARNEGWWQAIQHLPEKVGSIAAYPHYKTADIYYMTAAFLDDEPDQNESSQKNTFSNRFKPLIKAWLEKKGKQSETKGRSKQKTLDEMAAHPIGKDIIETHITITALGTSVLFHIPQIYGGWHLHQQNGEINGLLSGAAVASAAYGLAAAMKLPELPRLRDLYEKTKDSSNVQWTHEHRHMMIGYHARGEYLRDMATILPLAGFTYKGLGYMQESLHMYDWVDLVKNPPDLADSKIVASLSEPTWQNIWQAASTTDYTQPLMATASLIMLAVGAAYADSGRVEFLHQHGPKLTYIKDKFFKAVSFSRHSEKTFKELVKTENSQIAITALMPENPLFNDDLFNARQTLASLSDNLQYLKKATTILRETTEKQNQSTKKLQDSCTDLKKTNERIENYLAQHPHIHYSTQEAALAYIGRVEHILHQDGAVTLKTKDLTEQINQHISNVQDLASSVNTKVTEIGIMLDQLSQEQMKQDDGTASINQSAPLSNDFNTVHTIVKVHNGIAEARDEIEQIKEQHHRVSRAQNTVKNRASIIQKYLQKTATLKEDGKSLQKELKNAPRNLKINNPGFLKMLWHFKIKPDIIALATRNKEASETTLPKVTYPDYIDESNHFENIKNIDEEKEDTNPDQTASRHEEIHLDTSSLNGDEEPIETNESDRKGYDDAEDNTHNPA